ncbi:hypothetical protein PoMZ_13661, partial [Pyricularia oryzae]
LDIPEAGRRARGPGIASLQVTYAFYYCQPQTKKRKADLLQKYPCDPGCQWKRRSRFGPMTSDKHPFSALMIHLPKSLQVPESAPFGCIAEGPLQQCEWVSRLLIQTYRGTFLIDNAIVYVDHSAVANKEMGISKILERLKDFRHGNSKVNNLVARDNRSNAIPLPLEASSVADASHNLPYLPERTSNPNPMAPPTALLVPTTLETTNNATSQAAPRGRYLAGFALYLSSWQPRLRSWTRNLPTYPPPTDSNIYSFGRIGNHNVVAACPPAGQMGTNQAAVVASQMNASFPSLRFGVLVGIGGGVPNLDADIDIGDVVISQPADHYGGVVQYDFGKTGAGGRITRTGSLNAPPTILLNALAKL